MALKSEIVNGAYDQLRISGITVVPSPENKEKALNRLETMMAEFYGRNLCLGYRFEDMPDLASETGVEKKHEFMMHTNLAVRLIPDFNKQVPMQLERQAIGSYSSSSSMAAADSIRQVQPSSRMPLGSGNRHVYTHRRRYFTDEVLAPNECETVNMLVGDIDDFSESFEAYLDTETISSYTIEATDGLTLSADTINGDRIDYRAEATEEGTQTVTITITTSSSRVKKRVIYFEVA